MHESVPTPHMVQNYQLNLYNILIFYHSDFFVFLTFLFNLPTINLLNTLKKMSYFLTLRKISVQNH
jgi:hypothetical protein